ncbi:hypothetical protein FACS1894217_12350 [Clostridia bacterium]|nr:hypothetical protein FACS1894217_12350 [Clostridia bacterium]
MEFYEFANMLSPFLSAGKNTDGFVVALINAIMKKPRTKIEKEDAAQGHYYPYKIGENARLLRYIYEGDRNIVADKAKMIIKRINSDSKEEFENLIWNISDVGREQLIKTVRNHGIDVEPTDMPNRLTEMFVDILNEIAAGKNGGRKSRKPTDGLTEFSNELSVSAEDLLRLFEEVGGRCMYPENGKTCDDQLIIESGSNQQRNTGIVDVLPQDILDVVGTEDFEALCALADIGDSTFDAWSKLRKNKILLCKKHAEMYKADKGFTYVFDLAKIKSQLALSADIDTIKRTSKIDSSIEDVLRVISCQTDEEIAESQRKLAEMGKTTELRYSPLRITQKIPNDMDNLSLIRDIRRDVQEHYCFIEETFKRLKDEPIPLGKKRIKFTMIAEQIQDFCDTMLGKQSRQSIFNIIVDWIAEQAKTDDKSTCRIVASFFVQNCEVFNDAYAR